MRNKLEYIKSLYAKFSSESEIARELGISRQALYDYRQRHKIPYNKVVYKKKSYLKRWGDRNQEIVTEYIEGKPVSALVKKYGLGSPDINYILHKYNVKREWIHPSHQRNLEILKQRDAGMSIKDLADIYGINRYCLSTTLYKLRKRLKQKGKV